MLADPLALLLSAIPPDEVLVLAVQIRGALASVLDYIVQQIASGALANELFRHFVVRSGLLFLQLVNNLSIFVLFLAFSRVNWLLRKSRDSQSLLLLCHVL